MFLEITSNDVSNDGSCEDGKLLNCSEHHKSKQGCRMVNTLDEIVLADKQTFITFADAKSSCNPFISGTSACHMECWKDCKPCKISWQWFGRSESRSLI